MRQQRIDELTRRDHYYLGEGDSCCFFGEYSARNGRSFSDANALVVNMLLPVKHRNTARWAAKERAVQRIAQMFAAAFAPDRIGSITFVPLPPAQPKDHPDHDDRMTRVLHAMGPGLDVRELIEMTPTRETIDLSSLSMGPDALFEIMRVVPALLDPAPGVIFLVSDVLVTGADFIAAKRRLQQFAPRLPVYGLFAVRKLLETDDFQDPAKF